MRLGQIIKRGRQQDARGTLGEVWRQVAKRESGDKSPHSRWSLGSYCPWQTILLAALRYGG